MLIRNLTPHVVTIRTDAGSMDIEPVGVVPRVGQETVPLGAVDVDGFLVPIARSRATDVVDLPPPVDGTLLVVSRVLAEACPDRDDLVVPDGLLRDDQGRVTGATRLSAVGRGSPDLDGSDADGTHVSC